VSGQVLKVVAIGDMAVGKTSITMRFVKEKFSDKYQATIGVAHALKKLSVINKEVTMSIWDTGGQEMFDFIRPHYYMGADGGLIVYDVTRTESFANVERWFEEIYKNCGNIPIILIGNKIDLKEDRIISTEEGEEFSQQKCVKHFETSAKTGENILDVMEELAKIILLNTTPIKFQVKEG
jgi:Ras-related protein Rab-1A